MIRKKDLLDYARSIGLRGLGCFTVDQLVERGPQMAHGLLKLAQLLQAFSAERRALDGSPRRKRRTTHAQETA